MDLCWQSNVSAFEYAVRISGLKWTGMVNLTQMTITSTTVGKNPLEEIE